VFWGFQPWENKEERDLRRQELYPIPATHPVIATQPAETKTGQQQGINRCVSLLKKLK
jgi:hypothetical protein